MNNPALYPSVRKTLVFNGKKYSSLNVMNEFDCIESW